MSDATAARITGTGPEERPRDPRGSAGDFLADTISPEFGLLAMCCRWPPSPDRDAAIRAAAARPIDWPHFERVVSRQRVAGLVWHGLSRTGIDMPEATRQALRKAATAIARSSLALAAESLRLQGLFDQAGLDCAQVKGATLAALAYGSLGIRHAKDIDLAVPEVQLSAACGLLKTAGYEQQRPPPEISQAGFDLWRRYDKDIVWWHPAKHIELELHWNLTNLSMPINETLDFSTLQPIDISGSGAVKTLPPAQLFVYLCVHGAGHGWYRLKWLADIEALLEDKTGNEIEAYYRLAQETGSERALGQAFLLCADIFGLELPPDLSAMLHRSRRARLLARLALICMTRGKAETEIYQLPFGTSVVAVSHFLLARTPRAFLAEIARKSINLEDVLYLPLPKRLEFLYLLLRWPLWLCRRWKNAATR